MKLVIKDTAKDFLKDKLPSDKRHVFLALDDGSSKFSKMGGSCAIGNKFQFVFSNQPDDDYQNVIENNFDLDLTMSKEEEAFLGNGLVLEYKNAALVLRDDSGILDGAVSVVEYTEPANADQLKKRYGKVRYKNLLK
nr:iron-sulfur cluster biosynthesis family protein [Holzapfeliella floricola]